MAKPTKTTTKRVAKPKLVKSAPKPVEKKSAMQTGLRKKELVDRVVERSGKKKRDAKPVVEAMLAILGEALANGEQLNLMPMGKFVIKREKELENAKVMVCRIRQPKRPDGGGDTLPAGTQ